MKVETTTDTYFGEVTSIILEKGGTFGYETLEEKDVEPPDGPAEADGTDARAPTVPSAGCERGLGFRISISLLRLNRFRSERAAVTPPGVQP